MTLIAFVFAAIFSGIGILERIKPNGKTSMSTRIAIYFFSLMMITGIANTISQSAANKADNQRIIDHNDSAATKIDRKLDTLMNAVIGRKIPH